MVRLVSQKSEPPRHQAAKIHKENEFRVTLWLGGFVSMVTVKQEIMDN